MSEVKKVQILVACSYMGLMGATSAWGQVVGARTDNKTDELTASCRVAYNLSICNVYVTLANVGDRVFAVEADVFQMFDGNTPGPLFQVGAPFGADTAPSSDFFGFDPRLPCDSFVTIGLKDSVAGDETTLAPCPDPEACDWDSVAFNSTGLTDGSWFLDDETGGQGDAGDDKQVLIMQGSYPLALRMEGTAHVSWVALGGDGSSGTTTVTFECLVECIPDVACTDGDPCTTNDTCIAGVCVGEDIVCEQNPDPCLSTKCMDVDGAGVGECVDTFTCEAACCFPNGACGELLAPDCTKFGGTPQGAGTECASASCSACPEDLDGNGEVRVPDLIQMLAAWGDCPPAP